MPGDKRTWQGSAKSESYLKEFLEHCQRADLPGKQRIIELLQNILAGQAYSEERDPAQTAATSAPNPESESTAPRHASGNEAKPARAAPAAPPTEPAASPEIVTVRNSSKTPSP